MTYWIGVITVTGIWMIAILGISVLTGFTGLFSMGHAGFIAIGSYVCALVSKTFAAPMWIGIPCGMAGAILVGVLIGIPTLKLKGDYFVIATLGIGEIVKLLIENVPQITGGARGLTDIPRSTTFPLVLIICVLCVVFVRFFLTSKHGRNGIAVREDEVAARAIGINVARQKLIGMAISCGLCGLSGGLLAHYMGYLYPTMFTMAKSNELILTVILGGKGSLTGTILASLILVPLPEFLRTEAAQEWRMVLYGVLVVFVIIFRPSGFMGDRELSIKGIFRFFKNRFGKKAEGGVGK
ncbi:branched-chain amino acid ABC transporter permease [Ruminococcaceae bacterium OttesenSCG-928-D13]|nr:branched-chain amino acid ABC transporter permease [Ruminococcaceae bacterium OttesenSCG-928-D13]